MNEDTETTTNEESSHLCVPVSPRPLVSSSPELSISWSSPPDASELPRRSFSTQILWTLAARLLAIVSNVAAGVIVARWLGAAGVGSLAVLNVTIATAVLLGSAGLPSTTTYFIARDSRCLPSVSANALIFALIGGGALGCGVLAWAGAGAALFTDIPLTVVAVAATSIPFQLITLLGANIFLGVGSIGHFNTFDTLRQSATLLNALLALVVAGAGLRALVSLNTTASVLLSGLVIWVIYRYLKTLDVKWKWQPDGELFGRMARNGLRFHVATLVPLLIFRADLLIVKYFRGAVEAGVYDVATQVSLMLMLLPGVVGALLFPRVTAAQDKEGNLTCAATRHTAFFMLVTCLATVPAVLALPAIYGAAFADATVQSWLLLPGVFFVSIESVLVQHFSAMGLPRQIPLFWVATLAANLALNFTLVPAWGARGAALASAVSYTMIFVLVATHFRARTGKRLPAMLIMSVQELRKMLTLERFR